MHLSSVILLEVFLFPQNICRSDSIFNFSTLLYQVNPRYTCLLYNLYGLFGVHEVEYMTHIVSHEGVKVSPNNIKSINELEVPTSIKHLQGFLKSTRYYRKFVKNYGIIATPLKTLLKKDAFS